MIREKSPHLLSGVVQADETFIGGKNKNRHWNKKFKRGNGTTGGRSVVDKAPVVGLLQNDGALMAFVTDSVTSDVLEQVVRNNVADGSILVTDSFTAYHVLRDDYEHKVVKHTEGRNSGDRFYVTEGKYHTQGIENFWSIFKRGLFGVYHTVSRRHLQRYCDEFVYRYNTRHFTQVARFEDAIKRCECRLTYKQLTLKNVA
jgi:transposase-like protein